MAYEDYHNNEISYSEVKQYIRKYEEDFNNALMHFGHKAGLGFQKVRETNQYDLPEWQNLEYIKGIGDISEENFTGAGLCNVACIVLSKVLKKKFGDTISVSQFLVLTQDKDINQHIPVKDKYNAPHQIIKFSVDGDSNEYIIDPTYKQFQTKLKRGRTIIGPASIEAHLYTYRDLQEFYKNNYGETVRFEPKHHSPSQSEENFLQAIEEGQMGTATVDDYYQLYSIFND